MSEVLVFFDLDHTLLSRNSGVLYALFSLRAGRITRLDTVRSMLWAFQHSLGRLDVERAYGKAGALFRGMPGEELRAEVLRWFATDAVRHLRPQARRVVDEHRSRGQRTVLLTNSSSFIAEAASLALGLDAWLANDILLDVQGRVTGEVPKPLCYGPGKVVHAERFARARNAELGQAVFYSDSISDLPMLERVATPIAVHPDRRLKRVARARGWPVAHWG